MIAILKNLLNYKLMNRKIKRALWGTIITLFSLIILISGAIAITLNFIFTPAKITPMVTKIANENLNAKLSLNAVDITFFSTFPNFILEINDGSLLSLIKNDSLKNDTIVAFKRIDIEVNPIALIKEKKIVINRMELIEPEIYAAIRKDSTVNWDIMKMTATTPEEIDTVTVTKPNQKLDLSLSNIRIINGSMIFDNRLAGIYAKLDSVNMGLDGNLNKDNSKVKFDFSFKNALLWENNRLVCRRINFNTDADILTDTKNKRLTVNEANVGINDIKFILNGNIAPNDVDMNLALKVQSLESVLSMASFLDQTAKIKSNGEVNVNAKLKGAYKNGAIPVIDLDVDIKNGLLHYDGYKNGIDNLNVSVNAHYDLNKNSDTYIDIKHFKMDGASTIINLQARISNILKNPYLKYSTNSTINFTELAATLPFKEGIKIEGDMKLNSKGELSAAQLKKGDYAKIKADIKFEFNKVKLIIAEKLNSQFDMLNIVASNTKEGLLKGDIKLDGVDVNIENGRFVLKLDTASVVASGIKVNDSTSFLKGTFNYTDLESTLYSDSLSLYSSRSSVKFSLQNKTAKLDFKSDSLKLRALENHFNMKKARVKVTVSKKMLKGVVRFGGINLSTPHFPLPMSMPATVVRVNNQDITLKKASFRLGSSDLTITGLVQDLISASRKETPLTMRVDVSSKRLNFTEIIQTLNSLEKSGKSTKEVNIEKDTVSSPEEALKLFKVPQNIDFQLNSSFDRVELGNLLVDSVKGSITAHDGIAKLDNLSLNTLGANLATTLVYDSRASDDYAKVGLILTSKSIDVKSVIELVPSLDTIMPMINSFEGKLNFALVTDTKFYQDFIIKPNEVVATIALRGQDLKVMDGEVIESVAKLLMFKNKETTKVDSVSVDMIINNGEIIMYPFIVQIDRYKLAMGGQHSLDNTIDYHVSVLKSPIPIKFGVNIGGTIDDMKIRVGKTRYKYLGKPDYVKKLDPEFIRVGKKIRDEIKNI